MRSSSFSRLRSVALAFLLVATPGAVSAQAGSIVGRIVNAQNAEPLVSAQVFVPGGSGTLSDVDGRYILRGLPAGAYDVQVQVIGFAAKTVTGVEVVAGSSTALDITMEPSAIALEGITVSASAERGSTTSLLTARARAAVVQDAIGADQISRSPDGDAAEALKRVPGLSVVDGKFAFVRGLGERYSSTTLNGSPLASPVPDKKVIPLDLFPSGFLESIVTSKSYSPEQPGDYAGGLVQLKTKSFPSERVLSFNVSGDGTPFRPSRTASATPAATWTSWASTTAPATCRPRSPGICPSTRAPSPPATSTNWAGSFRETGGRRSGRAFPRI